jgi:hypothetical protein
MKKIKRLSECDGIPFIFKVESYSEPEAFDLLQKTIVKSREVISNIVDAYNGEWTKNPSTNIRIVFGHWFVKAMRFLATITVLCEVRDLSVNANIFHRQIFELYLQTRFYAQLSDTEKEEYSIKIEIFGCLEYLEKMESIKENEYIRNAFKEVSDYLASFDDDLVIKYKDERDQRRNFWFGRSFSQLANELSQEGEDLRRIYQITSSDLHGVWDLILDVKNPAPGLLDFRGYPDKNTLFIRGVETLDQTTLLLIEMWNEVAKSVGAEQVFYL